MRLSRAQEVADDHDSRRYAHSHMQRRPSERLQFGRGLDNRETGPHGVLGVVLMRLGIPKICEHSVAHIFRDETATASDQRRTTPVVSRDDAAHVFGIEPRRHRGRTDEVAEHDSKLSTLGGIDRRNGDVGGRGARVAPGPGQSGYRLQEPLAVSERHIELFEIGVGEIG